MATKALSLADLNKRTSTGGSSLAGGTQLGPQVDFLNQLGKFFGVPGAVKKRFSAETADEGGPRMAEQDGYAMSPELEKKLNEGGFTFAPVPGSEDGTMALIDKNGAAVGQFRTGNAETGFDKFAYKAAPAIIATLATAGLSGALPGVPGIGGATSAGSAGAGGAAGAGSGGGLLSGVEYGAGAFGGGGGALGANAGAAGLGAEFSLAGAGGAAGAAGGGGAGMLGGVQYGAGLFGTPGLAAAGPYSTALPSIANAAGMIDPALAIGNASLASPGMLANIGNAGNVAGAAAAAGNGMKTAGGNAATNPLWSIGGKLAGNVLGTAALGALGAGAANALTPDAPGATTAAGGTSLADIAQRQFDLANKTYTDQQAIFEKYLPQLEQSLNAQLNGAQTATDRSNNLWDSYTSVWQPVGEQYAKQVQDMANPARYEQAGQRAGASAAEQIDLSQSANERALLAAGASPEKVAALQAAGRLSGAKTIAGATTAGRMGAEQQGLAALQGGAQFGLNLPSMALSQQGAALQGASAAQSGVAGLNSLAAAPAALTSSMLGQAGSTIGQQAAINNSAFNNQLNAANQRNAIIGDVLGAGLGAVGQAGGFGKLFDGIFGD